MALSAQIVEIRRPPAPATRDRFRASESVPPPGLCAANNTFKAFERGFLDLLSDGQAHASAQLVRLCIGEPGRFTVPLYFVAGTSGGAAGSPSAQEATAADLLNPIGGNVSVSFTGGGDLARWGDYTTVGFAYHAGGRYLHARDTTDSGVPLYVGSAHVGIRAQTGAWDLASPATAGIAWLQVTLAATAASQEGLRRVFGPAAGSTTASLSVDLGVDIAGRVNAKVAWSRVLNDHGIAALRDPAVRIGLDFRGGR
jgi:hypothetical protein